MTSANGMFSHSVTEVMRALHQSLEELSATNVLLVTSGERWHYRQPEFPRGVTVLQVDCRHFHDPNSDRDLRGHLGRHRNIMTGLANCSVMSELVEEIKEFLRKHPGQKLVVNFFCTSGRHRSVGIATMFFYYIETVSNRAPMLLHFHSPEWQDMTCGGRCDQCGRCRPERPTFACSSTSPGHSKTIRTCQVRCSSSSTDASTDGIS